MRARASCMCRRRFVPALVTALILSSAAPLGAQAIYQAEQADGVLSYSDRPPDGLPSRLLREASAVSASLGVELERNSFDGIDALIVRNYFFGPVQIAIHASEASYRSGALPLYGFPVIPPRSETAYAINERDRARQPSSRYHLVHIPGDPVARHRPDGPYRLPYAVATRHRVSQAYPDRITHFDSASAHAIDFELPIGTGVHAARGGIVMDVAADYFRSDREAVDPDAPANIVRVLHDDGTMALYGHLQLHSIRVVPGQRIERGEYIADSGDTGFSTGPHLHFVVQHNRDGEIVSVPVRFATIDGSSAEVHSGEIPTAY